MAILRARRPCVRFKLSDIVSKSSMRPSNSTLRAFILRNFHQLHASNTLVATHTQNAHAIACSRTPVPAASNPPIGLEFGQLGLHNAPARRFGRLVSRGQ